LNYGNLDVWLVYIYAWLFFYYCRPQDYKFIFGFNDRFVSSIHCNVRRGEKILANPDYKIGGFTGDLAIVKFEKAIKFNSFVRTICLPNDMENRFNFTAHPQHCTVCGWGKMSGMEFFQKIHSFFLSFSIFLPCKFHLILANEVSDGKLRCKTIFVESTETAEQKHFNNKALDKEKFVVTNWPSGYSGSHKVFLR